ncbi:response regulator transcription factor [Clostridium autoethanogenum]|uniref:Stage 0 sporulation protein A homolog n=1 Tax=Clostridium autoethanogenum DSM 10061 TaxID=1341692 RepID=A0ABN4BNP7_9CLOT|nr:response regulator transcription factor [Clostridium autoethanogenum]AGY77716.1 response regulator transcription factor [Clostridium autoethanogenum DSM 10061]ALU37854.1 Two component transcriptional regulator [Clostridium autoethanogenum DSM 10061]OVY49795.1 Response regulator protein GraR [Clostridium autoethanogenum]
MYKIMTVEDDLKLCQEIQEALLKWGFNPVKVKNFEDILNEFVQNKPELVIMDINLPCFDGFYWCQKIREISKVPIIFLSSRNTNMDIIMAVQMGGDDFVTKPFSIDILVTKLHAMLRRTYSYGESLGDVLEFRGVILNINDSTLSYNENKIELTKNELKILLLLMKNIGKIISRDRIMRILWDDDTFINDNTLTVNVNRLRKKLEDIGIKDFIETKKGQGYVIL